MSRQLHDHKINPFNDQHVRVAAIDEPDENAGGACHEYLISIQQAPETVADETTLKFQHGPVQEAGVNGITDQALIAIILDRWRAFQKSKWANRETAVSITKLEEALMWQHKRTIDRLARKVEGTNEL